MSRYILFGILFMFAGELLVNFVFKETLSGFFGTMMLYSILLASGYGVIRLFGRWIRPTDRFILATVVFFGAFGLFVMEWIITGNSPWESPSANQPAMSIWWASVFVLPLLWQETDPLFVPLRQRSIRYHVVFSIILFVLIPFAYSLQEVRSLALFVFVYGLFPYGYFMGAYIWIARRSQLAI